MKRLILLLIAILPMAGMAAYAGSLGDLAIEEQSRRDSITNSITIILKSASPPVTDKEALPDKAENDGANQNDDSSKEAESDGDADLNVDDNDNNESHWRSVISDARNRVRQLEYDSTELTSRRNALQLQHDRTNGARRGPIKDEIERIRQSQENIRRDLEQARGELQSLLNEARSSGALPGWIE